MNQGTSVNWSHVGPRERIETRVTVDGVRVVDRVGPCRRLVGRFNLPNSFIGHPQ